MSFGTVKILAGVALVAAVGYVAWRTSRAVSGALDGLGSSALGVLQYVNPASDQNLIYQGANGLVQQVPGYEQDTLGTAIHRILNPWADYPDVPQPGDFQFVGPPSPNTMQPYNPLFNPGPMVSPSGMDYSLF